MADYTPAEDDLAALAMILHPDTVAHTPVTIAGSLSGRVYIFLSNLQAVANVDGVTFKIQGNTDPTASNTFIDVIPPIVTSKVVAGSALGINATEAIGVKAIAMDGDPTSDFIILDDIYVHDTNGGSPASSTGALAGAEANSGWHVVNDSAAGPNIITLAEGLVNEVNNDDEIVPDAEVFAFDIPNLSGYQQLRVIASHEGATGSDIHYRVVFKYATAIA